MNATVLQLGYGTAAVAFFALLVLTALSKVRSRQRLILLIVTGTNFIWASTIACSTLIALPAWLFVVVEVARMASWLCLTIDLIGLLGQTASDIRLLRFVGIVLPIAVGAYILAQPLVQYYAGINWLPNGGALWMLLPIVGLLLLENLFRNADRDTRWALKHLSIAVGVIYAYDFFYFADSLALGRPSPALYAARGWVNAMMVPLIALGVVRSRSWPVAIHVSRQVIFHSFALVGSGLYLLTMSAASYYLRHADRAWGPPLQIVFLIGAAAILAVILASGSARARAMHFVAQNFFSLKYDYRQTWMQFVHAVSSTNPGANLQRRVLDAVASVMESTGGGVWLRSENDTYTVRVSSNLGEILPEEPATSPLVDWLTRHRAVIELAEAGDSSRYADLHLPDWLRTLSRAWLVVPLLHRDLLQGFLVLATPRTERALDWEDNELLLALGHQAASYLAEEQSANALLNSEHLHRLGRRFAFVGHDLKNIVGQLSLLLRNVERFKDNAQFQDDMMATLVNSVDRMNGLLQQLRSMSDEGASEPLALDTILAEAATTWQRNRPGFSADLKPIRGSLRAPREHLRSVLDHLMQNAFDAAGSEGRVALRAQTKGNSALIEVEDNGPGMELDFVRNDLFRPGVSTRPGGFGIGAYQIREYIKSMGGHLEVRTAPGQGTTMQILLPLVASAEERASQSAPGTVLS